MILNSNRERSCCASHGALHRLDSPPVAGVRFDVESCHVAGRYQEQGHCQRLGWPLHFCGHVVDKGGVGAARALRDRGDDR
eukprot:9041059-Alexandrium_andersonii.AAC.1